MGFQQAAQTTLAATPARSHTPPQGTLGSVPGVGSALGWVWAGTGCPRRGQQPAGEASEARGPTWTPRAWRQCPADCMHQTTPHHAPPCVGKLGIAAVPSWTLRGWGAQRSDPVPVCLGRPRVSEALARAEEGCSLGSLHPLLPAPTAGPPPGNAGTGHESDPEDRPRASVRSLRDPAPTLDGGQAASGPRRRRRTKSAPSCL